MKTADFVKGIILFALPGILAACDDGKIYPSENDNFGGDGITVTMIGKISGSENAYGSGYSLALAAFSDGNSFAVVSKSVGDGDDGVTLSNVSTSASTIELCIINSLRKKVMTLASMSLKEGNDKNVTFNVGDIDASPFAVIDNNIFSATCIQCHGATGHAAAGLDLQPGEAYRMLVDVPSTVVEGLKRVEPGNASASTLWEAVATDESASWTFNHSNLLTSDESGFIENWINNLK